MVPLPGLARAEGGVTVTTLALTYCPDTACYAPAEFVDDYVAESTDGPVRHQVVLCANRHRYHVCGDD